MLYYIDIEQFLEILDKKIKVVFLCISIDCVFIINLVTKKHGQIFLKNLLKIIACNDNMEQNFSENLACFVKTSVFRFRLITDES